jgi:hypothetical protein
MEYEVVNCPNDRSGKANEGFQTPAISRREWLGAGLASAGVALVPGSVSAAGSEPDAGSLPPPDPKRLALLIGNRDYPTPFDLPPIHKNVRDLGAALARRGFSVKEIFDASLGDAKSEVEAFAAKVRAAPPDAVVLFYYSGHGAQVDARNLLLSAKSKPDAASDDVKKNSLTLLQDVIERLPSRPDGLTIAVIDACRTGTGAGGLNQVVAPPGCMIVFSTGAGKPALAPAVETVNTFFTGSLVKHLDAESDEMPFSDLFRFVRIDVFRTMRNHPIKAVQSFAQDPFIAENTRVSVALAPPKAPAPVGAVPAVPASAPAPGSSELDEQEDWKKMQAAHWPADIAKLAGEYLVHHPKSKRSASAEVVLRGANDAAAILQRPGIRLYRSSFVPRDQSVADEVADFFKASRGDKDAAARIGGRSKTGATSGSAVSRYEGWLQYAAELGNGIASYDLALHFRASDQPQDAARWEAKAIELGYTPPVSMDNVRK